MTTRFLIAIIVSACTLHLSRPPAQSEGADNFIPNQPPKTGADANASESQVVKYTLLLPSEKSSETVKDEERNPFGKSDDEMHDLGGKSSNEETKIQEQLSRIRVTGLSPGPSGLRVLYGDMWLSKNDVMPAVVKDQTLALRVNDITREAIQLVWMEKKFTGLPPRMLVIPVDLRATVRRVPHGQLPELTEAKTESKASKRATAVELPAPVAANGDLAEARKTAQLALAPMSPPAPATAPATPTAKDPIIAAAPGKLPHLGGQAPAPQAKNDPPPAASAATATQVGGPPAEPAESTAPQVATTAAPPAPPAATPPAPAAPAATEPPSWKRAMGLMDNLVKLSEANK